MSLGVVKKIGGAFLKIIHELHRAKSADDQEDAYRTQMAEICKRNPEMRQHSIKNTVSAVSVYIPFFAHGVYLFPPIGDTGTADTDESLRTLPQNI